MTTPTIAPGHGIQWSYRPFSYSPALTKAKEQKLDPGMTWIETII